MKKIDCYEMAWRYEDNQMNKLKYNYVFFNSDDGNARKMDLDGYNTICVRDLENMSGVKVVSYPLDYSNYFIRCLFWLHHTPRINNIIRMPYKKIWFPIYFRNDFMCDKPFCFVFSGKTVATNLEYIRFLKERYSNCKIVLIRRDLMKIWRRLCPEFTDDVVDELFDLVMSFDKNESEKYGMLHFDEFESALDIKPSSHEYECDVFFAGRAKDRLNILLEVYSRLSNAGLSCHFYLTGVPKERRVTLNGIEYADQSMSYREMLQRSINARCILEINQEGATGYTSRFLEAVIYNKKLITNNVSICETKFYNPDYILCFKNISEIDIEFIRKDVGEINYNYKGEFSPVRLIYQIDDTLKRGETSSGL